jgi:hypothetical protein
VRNQEHSTRCSRKRNPNPSGSGLSDSGLSQAAALIDHAADWNSFDAPVLIGSAVSTAIS